MYMDKDLLKKRTSIDTSETEPIPIHDVSHTTGERNKKPTTTNKPRKICQVCFFFFTLIFVAIFYFSIKTTSFVHPFSNESISIPYDEIYNEESIDTSKSLKNSTHHVSKILKKPNMTNITHGMVMMGQKTNKTHDTFSIISSISPFIRNINDPFNDSDTPLFWHVPKAAGSTMKSIMHGCLGMKFALKQTENVSLEVIQNFVNVDTSAPEGILKAKKIGLIESNMVAFIASSWLSEASNLFTHDHKGRIFTILRHPIERVVSLFHYLGKASWEGNYNPSFRNMTLLNYSKSHLAPRDWMTRFLVNKTEGELNGNHFESAKRILREKVVFGLINDMNVTVQMFIDYFGWDVYGKENCIKRLLSERVNRNDHKIPEKKSLEWLAIEEINLYDIRLYEYAKEIYKMRKKNHSQIVMRYPVNMLRSVSEEVEESDVPFFWHHPKSSSVVNEILSSCYSLKRAQIVKGNASLNIIGSFVNVNTETIDDIQEAKNIGLIQSGLPDVISSPELYRASTMFIHERKGRLFTFLRHPVEHAINMFYDLTDRKDGNNYNPAYKNMTLLEYANSDILSENWFTRSLVNEKGHNLTNDHVNMAVRILREKCVIGLFDNFTISFKRLQRYFGWGTKKKTSNCVKTLQSKDERSKKYVKLNQMSEEYLLLAARNKYDMIVYDSAKKIFKYQENDLAYRLQEKNHTSAVNDTNDK